MHESPSTRSAKQETPLSKDWSIYLLVNSRGRTYIGATTDPARRLRQHNGELVGGARATKGKGPWKQKAVLSGFATQSEAYRWEKLLKLRARGLEQRRLAFLQVWQGTCPPGKKFYQPPKGLKLVLSAADKSPQELSRRSLEKTKEGSNSSREAD